MIQAIHTAWHWYEPRGAWPGLSNLSPLISALSVLIAVLGTIWGDWLKTRLGWSGRTKLQLLWGAESPFESHAWIADVSTLIQSSWGNPHGDDRIKVRFLKLQVRNVGHLPARSVSVWIKTIEHLDDPRRPKPLENMISLRWSDFWRFSTDHQNRRVLVSDTSPTFEMLPAGAAKFCDLLFFYSNDGPPKIDRFQQNRLYLTISNLPSDSYSMSPGRHKLVVVLVSENSSPIESTLLIDFDAQRERVTLTKA